jgi:hypothetical protein
MQEDAADQLHVEGAQAQRALGGLAAIGEGFGQQVFERFAIFGARAQIGGFLDDAIVGQLFELGFQRIDLVDDAAERPSPCGHSQSRKPSS